MKIAIIILILCLIAYFSKAFKQLTGCLTILIPVLTVWISFALLLRSCDDGPKKRVTDLDMAHTFIKDNPTLCKKAKVRILDDGTIKIITKKKSFYLKDGVLMSRR